MPRSSIMNIKLISLHWVALSWVRNSHRWGSYT